MQYHVPRKILIIHQYRPDGDGLKDPFDPGQAEIADKRNLLFDPRVDMVIHIDSVGGYPGDIQDKTLQYHQWVQQDMEKYDSDICVYRQYNALAIPLQIATSKLSGVKCL